MISKKRASVLLSALSMQRKGSPIGRVRSLDGLTTEGATVVKCSTLAIDHASEFEHSLAASR